MPLTEYAREKILKHLAILAAWTPPSDLFLALHAGDPSSTGAANEASGGGYQRQPVTLAWDTDLVENTALVRFTDLPEDTYDYWSLKDASSGGNTLAYGERDGGGLAVPGFGIVEIEPGTIQIGGVVDL